MSELFSYKTSPDGINYLDFSKYLDISSGTVLKNENITSSDIIKFLRRIPGLNNSSCRKSENKLHLIEINQKHTNEIIKSDENIDKPADGVISNSPEQVLTVKTADCFPVFLYDGKIAGLTHAGWRGCFTGIIKNFFTKITGFDLEKAKAVIGPGIGSCCFEISPDVALLFDNKYRLKKGRKIFLDLNRFIVDELTGFGIKYILNCNTCTACNPDRFNSFRREGNKFKQMISYIYTGGS